MGKVTLRVMFVATMVAIGLALVILPFAPQAERLPGDEAAKARGEVVKDAVERGELHCVDFKYDQQLVCWEPEGVRTEEVPVPKAGSVIILRHSREK